MLLGRHTLALTRIHFRLTNQLAQGLMANSNLVRDSLDRGRHRRILLVMLQHQTHCPLTSSGIDFLRHDDILSTKKNAASNLRRFRRLDTHPSENVTIISPIITQLLAHTRGTAETIKPQIENTARTGGRAGRSLGIWVGPFT